MDNDIHLRQYVGPLISMKDGIRSRITAFFRSAGNKNEERPSWFNLFNKVSKIHLLEARERYWILRREVEMHIENYQTAMSDLNLDWRFSRELEENAIEKHFKDLLATMKSVIAAGLKNGKRQKRGGNGTSNQDLDLLKRIMMLLCYYKIMLKNRKRLTRRYEDLNLLWRDMNFVRTRLVTDGVIEKDRLSYQLDFCLMESKSLGLADDPEVLTTITETREELGTSDSKPEPGKEAKARRLMVSLMVKLNDLRIQRLFQQLYKKRMYALLSSALLVLSLILFNLDPVLKAKPGQPAAKDSSESLVATVGVMANQALPVMTSGMAASSEAAVNRRSASAAAELGGSKIVAIFIVKPARLLFIRPLLWIVDKIKLNSLIFIFFGGLTGGIFSTMMKFEPQNKLPGDELYIFWYRLTKPLIGAFGAMVIFIIVGSAIDSGAIISPKLANALTDDPRSATGFAVAFITGFSERFLLPKLI